MRPLRVAIFASGTGSNARSLIEKAQTLRGALEISFVLSDKATAPVLKKAEELGVRTYLVEKKLDRQNHEQAILNILREHRIDWILLAGYMRLLSGAFLRQFALWHGDASQVVNIHPSLLPAYPGAEAIERAYQDQVSHTGVTVHFVDEGMDTGKIIHQEALSLSPEASLADWKEMIHHLEHRMYSNFLESLSLGQQKTFYFEENQ